MRNVKLVLIAIICAVVCFNTAQAANIKITGSSWEEGFKPALAVDGNLETRWGSEFSDPQWLLLDLKESQEIKNIVLYWEAAHAKDYDILLSADMDSWQNVYHESNSSGATESITLDPPQQARFIKLVFNKRATEWGNSLWEIAINKEMPAEARVSASTGSEGMGPEKAVDGNLNTRWSSAFDDNQYWQIDFPKAEMLSGLTIHWETAYGEIYKIEVSQDGKDFHKVYETEDGDGNTDIIYFKPQLVKSLRFKGIQRGTGWGYSFWEIDFIKGAAAPKAEADNTIEASAAELAIDGSRESYWQSQEDEAVITFELPKVKTIGGLQLSWADIYAEEYSVDISKDGNNWEKVFKTKKGNGNKDWIYFPAKATKYIRINCLKPSEANKGFQLAELELKSKEEQATPLKEYQAAAKDAKKGYYPMWLRRVQEFWTITGVVGDDEESLITETGTIEPYKAGFSVMPFVYTDKLYTAEDCKCTQGLIDTILPLPWVEWEHEDWKLEVQLISFGQPQKSYSAVRYRLTNKTAEQLQVSLALAGRPIQVNPIWQRGGFSPIKQASCIKSKGASLVKINNEPRCYLSGDVKDMGAVNFDEGDIISYIEDAKMPKTSQAKDKQGRVSFGAVYDLDIKPQGYKDVVVIFPLYKGLELAKSTVKEAEKFFEAQLKKEKKYWSDSLSKFTIDIPEERLINVMKTNIAYVLLNKDGPWIKPGARNYNHSWMRDGAMTSVALLRMSYIKEVKSWLDAVTPHITADGYVPYIFFEGGNPIGFNPDKTGEGVEYDAQGEYVFALRQYVDFSGDYDYLEYAYPKAVKALEFSRQLRRERMTAEYRNDPAKQAYYGIIPLSNSHEGYYPAKHSYWDDFWVLRGFKDGLYLAKLMDDKENAGWIEQEITDFRKDLYASIDKVIKENNIDYIPGCVELADFDATSTAIGVMACGEENYLPQPYLDNTFNRYFNDFSRRLRPGGESTFTPYEVRSADAFIRMGDRKKALIMLRYFTEDSVRPYAWNHMAEVVHAKNRAPSYIGDMPHTWVGSGYISAVRTIFVYELEGQLIVAAGVDPKWFEEGIIVKDLPTLYGDISYTIKEKDGTINISLKGDAKPPKGFIIPLPDELINKSICLSGKDIDLENNSIVFDRIPANITIEVNQAVEGGEQ
jgi:hypothetical protein